MAKKRVAARIEYLVDHDADTTFTKIAGVKDIGDPSKEYDEVDVTDMDDTIEQMLPSGYIKMGEIKLVLFWDQADTANQGLLETLFDAGTVCNHQIKLPFSDGTIIKTYTGWVKMLGEVNHTPKGEITREVTIKVTTNTTVS